MKKFGIVALGLGLSASWSGISSAQAESKDFTQGTLAIGGERLMSFAHGSVTATSQGPIKVETTAKSDQVMILGQETAGPWALPRIGIDYFVIDRLSIGGTIFVGYESRTQALAGVSADASATDILFAPRVGYAIMFNDTIGVWPRGGFSYFHESVSPNGGRDSTAHFFSLNIEAPFMFFVSPGFAITAAPIFDLSITGGASVDTPAGSVDTDLSYISFGAYGGLLGRI